MDEQSTTDASVQDTGVDHSTQPEEQHAEAVNTDSESHTVDTSTTDGNESASSDNSQSSDEKEASDEWLRSKGLDPNDPTSFGKAANMAFNSEKMMSRSQQKSSELEKQLSTVDFEQVSNDPTAQRALEIAANVQLEANVERWKRDNNITPEQDLAVGDFLQSNPQKASMLKNGYLTLDDVYAISGAGKVNTEKIKSESRRDTLENLANQQRASSVTSNASTSTQASGLSKSNAEEWWSSLGTEGRKKPENQKKLDQVMSS